MTVFSFLKPKLKTTKTNITKSPAVARIADRTASQQTLTFRGNYLCARSVFPIQSCMPNLKPLAQVVFEILSSKRIGVTSLTFKVTWRHRSRDHSIRHMPFPIGASSEPSLDL